MNKFFLSVLFLLISGQLLAQENGAAKEFYPKGFVNEDRKSVDYAATPTVGVVTKKKAAKKSVNTPELQPTGATVIGIGAVINALDFNHLEKSLSTLFEVANRYDFALADIHLVAASNETEKLEPLITKLVFRGARVYPTLEVPSEYQVQRSPTWVIYCKENRILLEGLDNLAKYFNNKGEFIEPQIQE